MGREIPETKHYYLTAKVAQSCAFAIDGLHSEIRGAVAYCRAYLRSGAQCDYTPYNQAYETYADDECNKMMLPGNLAYHSQAREHATHPLLLPAAATGRPPGVLLVKSFCHAFPPVLFEAQPLLNPLNA